MNWRMVFSIVRKDLVDAVKNLYLFISMMVPIGFSLIFRIMVSSPQAMSGYEVLLYDPGDSRYGAILQEDQSLDILLVASEAEIEERISASEDIVGGVVIPSGFDATLERGEKPEVRGFVNEKADNGKQAVFRSIIEEQAWLLMRQEFPIELVWEGEASREEDEQQGNMITFSILQFFVIPLLIMGLILVGTSVVPALIVEEKEKHTLEALLVAPGGPLEIAIGKGLVGLVYSMLVSGIVLALNDGFVGNWPLTLLAVTLGALFCVGVGLLTGIALKVMQQVWTASTVVMLVLLAPLVMSAFNLPEPLNRSVYLFPTFHVFQLLAMSLADSATLSNSAPPLAGLAVSVVLTFAAVIWMLHRERK